MNRRAARRHRRDLLTVWLSVPAVITLIGFIH